MATHPSILAWRISQTEEPGELQSLGSQRVGCNQAHMHAFSGLRMTTFLKQWMTYLVFWARRKILKVQVKKIREPRIGKVVTIGKQVWEHRNNSLKLLSHSEWIRHCSRIWDLLLSSCVFLFPWFLKAAEQTCGPSTEDKAGKVALSSILGAYLYMSCCRVGWGTQILRNVLILGRAFFVFGRP